MADLLVYPTVTDELLDEVVRAEYGPYDNAGFHATSQEAVAIVDRIRGNVFRPAWGRREP